MASLSRTTLVIAVGAISLAGPGCDLTVGSFRARASDTISRSYPLRSDGELSISNTNGRVEVEATDGDTVEVSIERSARAATDAMAKDVLDRLKIEEHAEPARVTLETPSLGMMLGASVEVRYRVRAPRTATVRARTANGAVMVSGFSGPVEVDTHNGAVAVREAVGGVRATTTNGGVTLELASVGSAPVEASTTNGRVDLTIPRDAHADLSASVTNGRIDVAGVNLEGAETQSRRHVEGRLNGGGTHIDLRTTNGSIRVRARS